MADEPIEKCKRHLHDDLDDVIAALEFVTSAIRTYASSGEILAYVAAQTELRGIITAFRAARLADPNGLFQSLYVQAWSAFELFIRTLVVSYVEEVSQRGNDFESLDKAKLIERNIFHTGVALQQIFDNRSNTTIDFYSLARSIGTAVPGSEKVILNAAALCIFLRGPSVHGIEEALKRIGFKDFDWDEVGRAKPVQIAFGARQVRETKNLVIDFLRDAEKNRNNIVHRGEAVQSIAETDIRQCVAAFKTIGDALAEFLKKKI
jgi:hydrogenase maturation factor